MNIEVRRHTGVTGGIGLASAVVALAYLARALQDGAARDWLIGAVLGGLAVAYLQAWRDARTPIAVADEVGVRVRTGLGARSAWRGLAWDDVEAVEVLRRRRWRDGALDVLPSGRGQEAEPVSIPLSLSTRVAGLPTDAVAAADRVAALVAALDALAAGRAPVHEIEGYEYVADEEWAAAREGETAVGPVLGPVPGSVLEAVPTPVEHAEAADSPLPTHRLRAIAEALRAVPSRVAHVAAPADRSSTTTPDAEATAADLAPVEEPPASPTPAPLRDPVVAVRAEVASAAEHPRPASPETSPETGRDPEHGVRALRRPGRVDLVAEPAPWVPAVAEDGVEEPAPEPVIGPRLAAARARLDLSVDQLADRTRIRPHVIECLEVDDFGPCGGDFYARGHLRTLARVLGLEAAPLLADYDERYADAPIDPRRVFEAELAGAAIRGTRGGPNWSVLVAAVMVMVLAWSIVRLVTGPGQDRPTPMGTYTSATRDVPRGGTVAGGRVPVVLDAAGGGATVWVRDARDRLVFKGPLTFGQTKVLPAVAQPVRVQSSDGSLRVSVDGVDRGALGRTGRPAQATFVASN